MKKLWIWIGAAAVAVAAVVWIVAGGRGASAQSDVYFLNFKPEVAEVYERVAKAYESETGKRVRVSTAASGTYETTLSSEIAKDEAPTIFQVNGPVGLSAWKNYCADLSGSRLYEMLSDPTLALRADGQALAIPYAVEGYGIICNQTILKRYFALPSQASGISSTEEIDSFEKLKAVVTDMSARKAELGIEGVFASTSLSPGNQWRWQTHLLDVPLWYEFRASGEDATLAGLDAKTIAFSYGDGFRALFDLYLNHSVTDPALLSTKTVDDSMAEFALGKCAMVQNGNWGASQIMEVAGNTVDEMRFLPLFIGAEGEGAQGLCIGTENYLCVNRRADADKQQAAIDFLAWLFSSETGKRFVLDELGFIAPFSTFGENERPADPLSVEVMDWMSREGVTSVPWIFAAFPSEAYKDDVGDALMQYAQGAASWTDVTRVITERWAAERE